MYLNEAEIEEAGLDPDKVASIARRIERAAKEAEKLGITVFGGSSGSLRFDDNSGKGSLILTTLDGLFDGGCGAERNWGDGLVRGE